jgi:hypothetical protein
MIRVHSFDTDIWWVTMGPDVGQGHLPAGDKLLTDSDTLQIFTTRDDWVAALAALSVTPDDSPPTVPQEPIWQPSP